MQTILVIIAFLLAVGFLITTFIWNPFKTNKTSKYKTGDHSDCSKCSFH
ncbi:hypothetical protein [Aequorivita xiaoshiensis]|uniref:FeoB-associated Cys-rich membrane protein n=1 Tax=Aequorivita xiaoshiensis TaxID=2874476 RepID=A0A9X1U530_9FLAO|nr:hypothetical protein [Aequorivita xiaoshiensis]MCG2430123.1 hypothetical protein [Aequorivita xiaoshiensis]